MLATFPYTRSIVLVALAAPFLALPAPVQDPAPAPVAAEPTREERCLEWVDELVFAIYSADYDELCRLIDFDAIAATTTRGFDPETAFVKEFLRGLRSQECTSQGALSAIVGDGQQELRIDLLRLRGTDASPTALIRIVDEEGTFVYVEFPLAIGPDAVRATDIGFLGAGEKITDTYRRVFLPLALDKDSSWLDRLMGDESASVKHWRQLERVFDAAQKQQPDSLERRVRALPEELRRDKLVILVQIGVYDGEDPRYAKALEELMRHHPDDPATQIHAIDFHVLRGEHDLALQALATLDRTIGGDPYLDNLAAGLLLGIPRYDDAVRRARTAIERGLGWPDPYYMILAAHLEQKQHAATLAVLIEMDSTFEMEWNDLTQTEEYAEFTASPEHAQWLAHLAAKSKD